MQFVMIVILASGVLGHQVSTIIRDFDSEIGAHLGCNIIFFLLFKAFDYTESSHRQFFFFRKDLSSHMGAIPSESPSNPWDSLEEGDFQYIKQRRASRLPTLFIRPLQGQVHTLSSARIRIQLFYQDTALLFGRIHSQFGTETQIRIQNQTFYESLLKHFQNRSFDNILIFKDWIRKDFKKIFSCLGMQYFYQLRL